MASQKKRLKDFWRKQLTSPALVFLLTGVERSKETRVFFEPDLTELYNEDVETFFHHVQEGFLFLSRIRGKKQDAISMWNEIEAKKNSVFPFLDTEVIHSSISSKEKADLRDLANQLIKHPKASPFCSPVDPTVYPDYYLTISCPMDLKTWKENLGNYSSIKEALEKLRLVWKNCLQYNREDSEIAFTAIEMQSEAEKLISNKFGPHYSGSLSTQKRKRTTDAMSSVDYLFFKRLLERVCKDDLSLPFLHPVTDDVAPGYSSIIKQPMDLDTMKRKLKKEEYVNDEDVVKDFRLIWENCLEYNDPKSEIAENARQFRISVEKLLEEGKSGKSLSSEDDFNAKQLTKIIRSLKEFSPYSKPFLFPVKESEAPGYSSIVKEPMSLSTIEERIAQNFYVGNIPKFLNDVALIWKNCRDYNLPDSEICQWAEKCETFFNQELLDYPGILQNSHRKKVKVESSKPTEKSHQISLVKEIIGNSNPPKLLMSERKVQNIIDTVFSDPEFSDLFSPSNQTVILDETKMSFTLVKDEIKKLSHDPVQCFGFLKETLGAISSKAADKYPKCSLMLSRLADLFRSNFPDKGFVDCVLAEPVHPFSVELDGYLTTDNVLSIIRKALPFRDAAKNSAGSEEGFAQNYAQKKGLELLRHTKLPFRLPSGSEIVKFGDILPMASFYSESLIYPVGYSVQKLVRLVIKDSTTGALYPVPYVEFPIHARIESTRNPSHPIFVLNLEYGTLICSCPNSPLNACMSLLGKESAILNALGAKLRRCRSVFNRLCISPDAVPFLEQIPLDNPIANNYYRVIKSPMWFREIHNRLVGGLYDNEFDFAWDVRLVFRNCTTYNLPGSALFNSAERLSAVFDHLFCDWVLNIRDHSIDDLATGIWDDWSYLKYFDEDDPAQNFCRASRSRAKASELLRCKACEDQYLPASLGLSQKPARSSTWMCSRCVTATDGSGGDLKLPPSPVSLESSFSAAVLHQDLFTPAPDYGAGWFQARKRGRAGVKNLFMSPLGYEVTSKEDLNLQKDFEETIDNELMAAREKEFKDLSVRKSRVSKRGRTARVTDEVSIPEELKNSLDEKHMDSGRVIYGKLDSFKLPDGLIWSVVVSTDNNNWQPIESVLPSTVTGFFELESEEVRSRIEGLANANECEGYTFINSLRHENEISMGLEEYNSRKSLIDQATEALRVTLLDKRWGAIRKTNSSVILINSEATLPLSTLQSAFDCRSILRIQEQSTPILFVVWDFLASIYPFTGLRLTFQDLVDCINPPTSILHTVSQVMFDEVCATITQFLQEEVRSVSLDACWQEHLISRPVNCITWPKVVESILLVLSLPLSEDQTILLLNSPLQGESLIQLKALTLLYNHPLISAALTPPHLESFLKESLERIILVASDPRRAGEATRDGFCMFAEELLSRLNECSGQERDLSSFAGWFRALLGRMGYLSTEETDSSEVVCEDLVGRSWGGFNARFLGTDFGEDIMQPWVIDSSGPAKNEILMKSLFWFERTLSLLSSSDPESWSSSDRVSVLASLVDYGRITSKFREERLQKNRSVSERIYGLSLRDLSPLCGNDERSNETSKSQLIPKTAKCILTGVRYDDAPIPDLWTTVPNELIPALNVLGPESTENSNYAFRQSHFALKTVLGCVQTCLTHAAKDAERDRREVEIALADISKGRIDSASVTVSPEHFSSPLIARDSLGNSFWAFDAQRIFSVFPIEKDGQTLGSDKIEVQEPCLLLSTPEGSWHFFDGRSVGRFLEHLQKFDSESAATLTRRFLALRGRGKYRPSVVTPSQKVWIDRKSYIEKWAATNSLYTGSSDNHRCRQLEVQLARCSEARMCLYYADFFQEENTTETTMKRLKDYQSVGSLDYHGKNGWQADGLKRLSCSTIATRIHSDPTVASTILQHMREASDRKKHKITPISSEEAKLSSAGHETSEMEKALDKPQSIFQTLDDYLEQRIKCDDPLVPRAKAILQVNNRSNEVVAIYPSIKEAATATTTTETAIILSLHQIKDPSRWKWKSYDGPQVEYDLISHLFTPAVEMEVAEAPIKPIVTTESDKSGQRTAPVDSNAVFPAVVQPRLQHHLVSSTKTTSSKLVKLKAEIFSILFAFPEKALKWPELDADSEAMILAAGESAYNNVLSASGSILSVAQDSGQVVDINKMAEKASRKARRRLRRKLALDIFTKAVQSSITPNEILTQVMILESAIPQPLTVVSRRIGLPTVAHTSAEVALRLFALDRSISYDEIHFVENAANAAPAKLRVCFSLRCHLSGSCSRYLGHSGKCTFGAASFSRLPDQFQIAPPNENATQNTSTLHPISGHTDSRTKYASSTPSHRPPARPVEDYLPRLASFLDKEGMDIETVNPWIPSPTDITMSQWI